MDSFEATIKAAIDAGKIPGAVLVAANKTGTFNYAKAFGYSSLDEAANKPALELDTVFRLFSATKLLTTISVLQLVEQGKIALDDDVAAVLPEVGALKIMTAFTDGKPTLIDRKNPVTLKHLLTHTSGMAYPFTAPSIGAYLASIGKGGMKPPKTVVEDYSTPLVYEPGTSWKYSVAMDWVGVIVARLSGLSLEAYMQKNIFAPLGISDITFWPEKTPALAAKLVSMSARDKPAPEGTGLAVPFKGPSMVAGAEEEFGGQGLTATMPSYLKVLQSLLTDDGKLLKKETTAQMFTPQLGKESRAVLQAEYDASPAIGPTAIGHFPPKKEYNWGLGGLLSMEDIDWRKKGTLTWSGMPNLYWFVDREAGLCGLFGCQLMPGGDKPTKEITTLYEKTLYEQAAKF